MAIGCVVVLCALTLVIMATRRWQRSRGLLPTVSKRSRVLETLSLGPGKTVSLIEIDGMRALVGADSGGIRTIVPVTRTFEDELDSDHDEHSAGTDEFHAADSGRERESLRGRLTEHSPLAERRQQQGDAA